MGQKQGEWDYRAGVDGPRSVEGRVLQITAVSVSGTGQVQINGGDAIPVPEKVGITITPEGNLIAPDIVFTGTASYFVEYVV